MLKGKLKGQISYPPQNADIIIYNFLIKGENVKQWSYDVDTKQFKTPMKNIKRDAWLWHGKKTNGETNEVKGTNIYWKIENEMFVFGFA